MNKKIPLYLAFLCSSLLLSHLLSASDVDDPDVGNTFIEAPKWQEKEVTLPPFPNREELIRLEVDRVDMPFSFYIDPTSLALGEDGVTRYSIVIESNSGASNVMYEGIRCSTKEYRTYAYGTYDNKFSEARNSSWSKIPVSGAMAHRYNLNRYYFCNDYFQPLSITDSLQRIRYPENFAIGGSRDD